MKKLLFVLVTAMLFIASCGKLNDELDALDERLDKIEGSVIPAIDKQIASINTSINALERTDEELKGYIKKLEATAHNIQEQITATNEALEEVEASLKDEILTAKVDVLAQLNATKVELEGELSQINAAITTLKAKDAELDTKIAELTKYVDVELENTTDWVNATFSTLEQYNQLVAEITAIKGQIEAINKSIADLETRLTTKINEDINNAVSTLNAEIQQQVKAVTDGYASAVKDAKESITAAYTEAIKAAIADLDTSLKSWVSEQLTGYYTIAEVDVKLNLIKQEIKENDDVINEKLNSLRASLETTKSELIEAYKNAIKDAINEYDGVITTQIATEINKVNKRIDEEVAVLNDKLAILQTQVNNNTANIAKLLARIQSISYIPQYDDGKATVKTIGTSRVTLNFEVSPKGAISELAEVWEEALNVKAVYTKTRAVEFVDMPIISFEADKANGVITIVASGENLSPEFYEDSQTASARLAISDGNNSITSEYISLVYEPIPSNEIWYTATRKVTPNEINVFGANITSNEWDSATGNGIITFDGNVSSIGDGAFWDCSVLTNITIPNGVTLIGRNAFLGCTSLTNISLPDSVLSLGHSAFSGCEVLSSFTIPNSVTSIGNHTFYGCKALTSITIPESVTSIEEHAFSYCESLTSINIPDSVISIEDEVFYGCRSLANLYCRATTPPSIGGNIFSGCNSKEFRINVPLESENTYKTTDGWSDYADKIVGYDF